MDAVSLYHQSLYGWWGGVLGQLIHVMRSGALEVGTMRCCEELFDEIDDHHRFVIVSSIFFSPTLKDL